MNDIISKSRYKVYYIAPKKIKYCIFPSKYTDYNQFNKNLIHPHSGNNRGVFNEDIRGYIKINNSNWDYKHGILFSELLEYKSLFNHFNGKENWKKSQFALRYLNYLKKFKIKKDRNLNIKNFLSGREKQIDALFNSILKNGIYPVCLNKSKKLFVDNISVVLTANNEIYFNNRGHHRLAISKILGLKKIPIKFTLAKSKKKIENFIYSIEIK